MKVRALIADDERLARERLARLLDADGWIECVGTAADGLTALEEIERLRPDVAFLDIRMPGLTGTEVAARLGGHPFVVFTTAWSEFAVTAFELHAIDYLLKPVSHARMKACLARVREELSRAPRRGSGTLERVAQALAEGPVQRLFVRQGGSLRVVAVAGVIRFEADRDYVIAHAEGARHVLHVPISRLEARLDAARFLRVHRSHIVNLEHVESLRAFDRSRLVVELKSGDRIVASRERSREIRRLGL